MDRAPPAIVFGDLSAPLPAIPETTVPFTITDANPVTLSCKLDAGAPVPCTAAAAHTMSGVSDGQHSLSVTATDAAGNTDTDLALFSADATAPALALTGGPGRGGAAQRRGGAVRLRRRRRGGSAVLA